MLTNAPAMLNAACANLLNELADYLIKTGASFAPGELYASGEQGQRMITFAEPTEEDRKLLGPHERALVVLMLP